LQHADLRDDAAQVAAVGTRSRARIGKRLRRKRNATRLVGGQFRFHVGSKSIANLARKDYF
jgi:hypothetical protein